MYISRAWIAICGRNTHCNEYYQTVAVCGNQSRRRLTGYLWWPAGYFSNGTRCAVICLYPTTLLTAVALGMPFMIL